MLSNPLETLAVLACEGWNFDRFDAWAEETFLGSGRNFAVDQKVNFALKSLEHNGAVKFCLVSYNFTGNQSRVLVEDRFSFGDAQGVEIFSDKVIWFQEKFYLLVTTEKESDNLNIVCLNADTKLIESKFTISKYESFKNSHQTSFLDSKVLKTYKDSQNQTIKAKLILFFETHIQILVFTYPNHFVVTKRFVTNIIFSNPDHLGNH